MSKSIATKEMNNVLDYFYQPGPMDEYYELQRRHHWTHSEINVGADQSTFKHLSEDVRSVIKEILMFFLLGDKVIIDNINNRMMNILDTSDCERYFTLQAAQELIHVDTYTLIAKAIFPTVESFQQLLRDVIESKSVQLKIGYGHKWTTDDNVTDIQRVFSFICNEGIFFFTQFKIVSEIRRVSEGMTGLDDANAFIRKDELIHRDAGIKIAKILIDREANQSSNNYLDVHTSYRSVFEDVVRDAVEVEEASIDDIFKGKSIPYLNATEMKKTARICANDIAIGMGYPILYDDVDGTSYGCVEQVVGAKSNVWERSTTYSAASDVDELMSFDDDLMSLNI